MEDDHYQFPYRLSYVLFDLATHSEYSEPLREGAAPVEEDDWTRAAIEKMDKIDNFPKELIGLNTI